MGGKRERRSKKVLRRVCVLEGDDSGGPVDRGGLPAQLSVRMFSRSWGLRMAGPFPPAAAMSCCTAASQENVSRAVGT